MDGCNSSHTSKTRYKLISLGSKKMIWMKWRMVLGVWLMGGILAWCGGAEFCNREYDYLELALRWPNSYCATREGSCRDQVPQQFTIAHLRPVKRSDPDLQYCPTPYALSDDIMEKYKNELERLWPDLTTDNFEKSEAMWRDQWNMYGSCGDCTLTPQDYILTALNRRNDLDLKKLLRNAGIVANGNEYPPRGILQAIRKTMGVVADIVCETDKSGENYYLSEIRFCLDCYGKKLKDCENQALGCEDEPIFPYPDFQPHVNALPPPPPPPYKPTLPPRPPPRYPPTPYWEYGRRKNRTAGQRN